MNAEPELHLLVLWEKARVEEARILADVARHVEIVARMELAWPGDPVDCFGRFYGAKLAEAAGKVKICGGGPFLLVVVRDRRPRYGWRETSRGGERVNLRLFAMKARYRAWTGGGHRVHTTNSPAETRRDLFLLTGRSVDEWVSDGPTARPTVLPGHDGWPSLRDLFKCLGETMPYVVLRNSEMLPDAFDPSLHGDIDLLVPDASECAGLLGARKVFPEAWRVHYEVTVAGRPVRFDFRFVGDGYYDERWERKMIKSGVLAGGVRRPAPEDAFYALVYHALFQKRVVASDYEEKARTLARAAGLPGESFEDWLDLLEDFLARNRYAVTKPVDSSVYLDDILPSWRAIADEMHSTSPLSDIRPAHLAARCVNPELPVLFFSAELAGRPVFVKYSPVAPQAISAEWTFSRRMRSHRPDLCVEPLFWHTTAAGGAFVAMERLEGQTLAARLTSKHEITTEEAKILAEDMKGIVHALEAAGIVHRDIRPANLMISPDGHVKIFDFQFAVERDDPGEYVYFAERHKELLYPLGEDYARGPGKWNDRHSMVKCLEQLPDCPAKAAAIADLSEDIAAHDRIARLPDWLRTKLTKEYKRLLRRHWRHRLLLREDKPHDIRRRKYLEYILSEWD